MPATLPHPRGSVSSQGRTLSEESVCWGEKGPGQPQEVSGRSPTVRKDNTRLEKGVL